MWIYVFWNCICVFLYMCICVFAILDTHNYHLWGPVLSRNHCRQTFILYIRAYMPSADCTLLRSRGGGAIVLKVHLPPNRFMETMWRLYIFRKGCKFWPREPISCQKTSSKIQKNMTPKWGFVRSADFLPYIWAMTSKALEWYIQVSPYNCQWRKLQNCLITFQPNSRCWNICVIGFYLKTFKWLCQPDLVIIITISSNTTRSHSNNVKSNSWWLTLKYWDII